MAMYFKTFEPIRNQNAADFGKCLLPDRCYKPGHDCATCGFYTREAQRRLRLPLWRNDKGLWQKHVGRVGTTNEQ